MPDGRVIGRKGRAVWLWVWALEDIGVFVSVVADDYDNTTTEGRKKMWARFLRLPHRQQGGLLARTW
ncbi:hypothetical protein QBA54_18590 [Streptomyces sp. B21-108]|uniref:hypothetical protein n=1 Tax=Streptomyces sp. B21-108 TaxID=3039419 RepID=UPI002FF0E92B